MKPSAWALRHPVPVLIVAAGAVLFGIVAFFFLNREFVPPIMMPSAAVVTLRPGVAAEAIERDITEVLEDHFSSLPGLTDLSSESREGVSIITLKFKEDAVDLLQEVRVRVDRALPELPADLLSAPAVSTWGASDLPVFSFTVSGPWDNDRVTSYVEDVVVPELFRVDGVAGVETLGGRKLELRVTLDVDALKAANISALEVLGAIRSRNTAMPSGLVDWNGGQWAFNVTGEFSDIRDLENLVVGNNGYSAVYLADVSQIAEVYADTNERVRSGLQDLVAVQVTKKENGNVLTMSRDIQERLSGLEEKSRDGFRFTILHDDSKVIRQSLGSVMNTALTGVAMAIAIIWLFLRSWRFTLVVAVSLPVSLVVTFAGMKLAGQSLNILTLTGITISLGMVVDASIVMLEEIHRRHALGESPEMATLNGSGSISGAIFASTTTSLVVFAPMMFLTGIIGSIMKDLSLTIVLCLGASLIAALVLIPPLARRVLLRKDFSQMPLGFMTRMEKFYGRILTKALKMSGAVILSATVILAISVLAADLIGISFIPAADYDELFVALELRPGASLEESTEAADRAEAYIRSAVPELKNMVFYAGMENDLVGDARSRESVWGQLQLYPLRSRNRSFREIITAVNDGLGETLPGVAVTVFNGGFDRMVSLGTDGSGFRVELRSETQEKLNQAADQVQGILSRDPDVLTTARNVNEDRRFVEARLDPGLMGSLGMNAYEAALTSRIVYDGMDAGDFRPDAGEDRNIRLATSLHGRVPDSTTLGRIPLRTAGGGIISLDSVSTLHEKAGVSGIRHQDRARSLTVIAQTRDENFRDVGRRFESALEARPLEDGVDWRLKGVSGLIGDSFGQLALVLGVALFLVYAVMAIQFEKLMQPLIIMVSVPFCFIGVVGGLAIFGSDISLISFLGIVTLAGIVVNNAIVQVDRINQLRADGMELEESVVKGSVTRLRPILMTTLTTFFGVLPLSLARGSGAEVYGPLGQAIAGGLATSTLVTLILVPVLYTMLARRQVKTRAQHNLLSTKGAA